jgi:hypothetical protein
MNTWRDTAIIPDGAEPNPDAVDAVIRFIPADQRVLLGCRSLRFEISGWVAQSPILVLTDRALIVAKDRLFGRPKADRRIPLQDITAGGCGPLLGVGPTWEVVFRTHRYSQASIYFPGPAPAEQVHAALQAAVSSACADAADPDLAQFRRSVAAGDAQPPGDAGGRLTPAQVVSESRRVRQLVDSGQLRPAWDRRVQLGYGVPTEGIPQADRFWLDAAPAIAALRLGLRDHPMVAMCCGMADSNQDPGDPEQRAAAAEFTRLYHGSQIR